MVNLLHTISIDWKSGRVFLRICFFHLTFLHLLAALFFKVHLTDRDNSFGKEQNHVKIECLRYICKLHVWGYMMLPMLLALPRISLSLTRKMCVCVCGEDASHQYFTIWVYYWTLNAVAKSILYVFVYLCVCGVRVCELKMLWLQRRKKLSEKKHSLTLEHIYEMTCLWVKCYCTTINKNWTLNGQNWDLDRLRVTVGNGIREEKKTPNRTK